MIDNSTKLFLIFVMTLTLGLGSAMAQQEHDKPVIGMDGVALDSATLEKLKVQALDGSGDAARKISIHYLMSQGNREKAIYWALIAAENGDSVGQYHAGFLLKDDPDSNNRRRAIFWLKKSFEQGESLAQELLQEIQSNKSKPVRPKH